jgi:hypothetical protein
VGANRAAGLVKRRVVTPTTPNPARPGPSPTVFAGEQLDALTRQQQRIMHRSALLAYMIAAETRSCHALTLGDALLELLADITEAARMIGTILQQVGSDGPQHLSTPPGAKVCCSGATTARTIDGNVTMTCVISRMFGCFSLTTARAGSCSPSSIGMQLA